MSAFLVKTERGTQRLASRFAKYCPKNQQFVIFLSGELGTGKTYFSRSLLKSLGHRDLVKSPTYTLVETYQVNNYVVHHLDLYRLHTPIEILDIGLYDNFDQAGIWLIEWPERAISFLPKPDIVFNFNMLGSTRQILCHAATPQGHQTLAAFEKNDPHCS